MSNVSSAVKLAWSMLQRSQSTELCSRWSGEKRQETPEQPKPFEFALMWRMTTTKKICQLTLTTFCFEDLLNREHRLTGRNSIQNWRCNQTKTSISWQQEFFLPSFFHVLLRRTLMALLLPNFSEVASNVIFDST